MDDKEIDKIVKLVKDGKITVSNDTLAFNKDYVKKQNKRTISGPSHEKGINYLSKNLKLSDKVSFYCTKSGKLTLRGGKDAAKDLRHDIKVSLKSKRIGETRRAVYNSIFSMLDIYIADLENKAAKKAEKKVLNDVANNVSKYIEDKHVESQNTKTIEHKSKKTNLIKETKQKQTNKNNSRITQITKGMLMDIENRLDDSKKVKFFTQLLKELPYYEKKDFLVEYLKLKSLHGNLSFISSLKLLFAPRSVEENLVEDLCSEDFIILKQDLYVIYCNNYRFEKSPNDESKLDEVREKYYNNLTQKQRYEMRVRCFAKKYDEYPNILRRFMTFLPKTSKVDDDIIKDIFYKSEMANVMFENFLAENSKQNFEQSTSDNVTTSPKTQSSFLKTIKFKIKPQSKSDSNNTPNAKNQNEPTVTTEGRI